MGNKTFSLSYEERLSALNSLNAFIHSRNKKLKYCYNPMLIAEAQKANIWSIRQWAQNLIKSNNDKAKSLDVYLLGGFPIDKIEDEEVYTVTWIGATEYNTDTVTYTMTYKAFRQLYSDDFTASLIKTRKDTFYSIAIVFTEKDEEQKEENEN